MSVYEKINHLGILYKDTYQKIKDTLEELNPKGQLKAHLQEEHDRLLADLELFNPKTTSLILQNSKRKNQVESELRIIASKMSKKELIEICISQELDIWNLEQILSFVTKRKQIDNKARLEGKTDSYSHSRRRNSEKSKKFAPNEELLLEVLTKMLSDLGRIPVPHDYREFKIRAERTKPIFIPKPRENAESKLDSPEFRKSELERKTRNTWSDGTLRRFWTKHTKLAPSTKKPSTLK